MQADWVREIRSQCAKAKVAFFFKQWGGPRKDVTGRVLDGKVWNAMPRRWVEGRADLVSLVTA